MSQCKGPEAGTCVECSKSSAETRVMERSEGEGQRYMDRSGGCLEPDLAGFIDQVEDLVFHSTWDGKPLSRGKTWLNFGFILLPCVEKGL